MKKLFIVFVFAVRKKILNYESGTHNFVYSTEVRGTRAKRAHEASMRKKDSRSFIFSLFFLLVGFNRPAYGVPTQSFKYLEIFDFINYESELIFRK